MTSRSERTLKRKRSCKQVACRNSRIQREKNYIDMEHGFEYLKMAVDVYSRRILAHRLAITPEAVHAKDIVQKAFKCNGRIEIINPDLGSPFQPRSSLMPYCNWATSYRWIGAVPGGTTCSSNASGAQLSTNACTSRRMNWTVRLVTILISTLLVQLQAWALQL